MNNVSLIEVNQRVSVLGRIEAVTYNWIGKSPYVRISWDLTRYGDIKKINGEKEIQIGPYRLLQVDDWFYGDCWLYVRKNKFGLLRVALYKSTRLLDLAYRRAIITLAIWRLADYGEGYIPSWRDIKIVKRLLK